MWMLSSRVQRKHWNELKSGFSLDNRAISEAQVSSVVSDVTALPLYQSFQAQHRLNKVQVSIRWNLWLIWKDYKGRHLTSLSNPNFWKQRRASVVQLAESWRHSGRLARAKQLNASQEGNFTINNWFPNTWSTSVPPRTWAACRSGDLDVVASTIDKKLHRIAPQAVDKGSPKAGVPQVWCTLCMDPFLVPKRPAPIRDDALLSGSMKVPQQRSFLVKYLKPLPWKM